MFAERVGISLSGLRKWLDGSSEPGLKNLIRISEVTGSTLEWVATGREVSCSSTGSPAQIPPPDEVGTDPILINRYDVRASAGGGCFVEGEQVTELVPFSPRLLRELGLMPSKTAIIDIEGDSMEPTLRHGDLVLVDLRRPERDGVHIIRIVDCLMAKRLQFHCDGSITVRSDNPAYEKMIIPRDRRHEVCVIGRVAWAGRRM